MTPVEKMIQRDSYEVVYEAARGILGAEEGESLLSVCGRIRDMLREHVDKPKPIMGLLTEMIAIHRLDSSEKDRGVKALEASVESLTRTLRSMTVAGCAHCGRVYVMADDEASMARSDRCDCGAELYPVSRKLFLGQELCVSTELGGRVRCGEGGDK